MEAPLWGRAEMRVFGFQDFVDEALRQLRDDPYTLIKDPDRVRPPLRITATGGGRGRGIAPTAQRHARPDPP